VEVTDLSFLKTLKTLKYLTLNNVPAKDLSPVGELTELKSIYFYSTTAFDDYSPLANCTKLETLQARRDTGFNKLEVIKAMPNLRTLYLEENTEVQDWDVLATATNLETLAVEGTSFTDLNLLKDMSKLSSLDVDKCTVTNVKAILDKPLRYLYLKDTKGIDDLMIFKDLPKLADLNIYYEKEQFPQDQVDALNKAKEEAKKKKQ
jgi:Leucine-rich repeat (LRR) protein